MLTQRTMKAGMQCTRRVHEVYMNVFDIIGPVMIGPSSSHTAGAVRLGRVVNKLIDDRKLEKVEIILSGSFAQT